MTADDSDQEVLRQDVDDSHQLLRGAEDKPETYSYAPCSSSPPEEGILTVMLVLLFFICGAGFGYFRSVYYDVHEHGMSYEQQSLYSITMYPMWYKILCALILDSFFHRQYGKAKSYLVPFGFVTSVGWLFLSLSIDRLLEEKRVVALTCLTFTMNQLMMFFGVACDCLLLKTADPQHMATHTMIKDIAYGLGELFAYNAFLPLNSVKFLNSGWLGDQHFTQPILTHCIILNIMFVVSITATISLFLFFKEQIVETKDKEKNIKKVLRMIPRFFTNPTVRLFLIYMLFAKFFRCMISSSLTLKFMDYGFSKALVSLVDTCTFPIFAVLSYIFIRKLMADSPMKINHIMVIIQTANSFLKWAILKGLQSDGDKKKAFILLVIITLVERFSTRTVYFNAFINKVTPLEIGPTYVSLVFSLDSMGNSLPNSIGLMLVNSEYWTYDTLVITVLAIQLVFQLAFLKYAFELDGVDKKE